VLFFGERQQVEKSRCPPEEEDPKSLTQIIYPSTPRNQQEIEHKLRKTLDALITTHAMEFGFMSGFEHPVWGTPLGDTATWGYSIMSTETEKRRSKCRSFLAYQAILPFFRPDLTDAEKMSLEWFAANILVHETMVSVSPFQWYKQY
jgi:hypothetical protein